MTILKRTTHRRVGLAVIIPAAIAMAAMVPALAAVYPTDPTPQTAGPELKAIMTEMKAAEERIAPVTEVLRRLPLTRVFHLLLLRKGERLVPEELQEKMARLDDSSLFLLPLESGKDTSRLLRTMLGRILP